MAEALTAASLIDVFLVSASCFVGILILGILAQRKLENDLSKKLLSIFEEKKREEPDKE
mgnify:FL=1|jgi:hypothetical protein